jgi:hypothetical protein
VRDGSSPDHRLVHLLRSHRRRQGRLVSDPRSEIEFPKAPAINGRSKKEVKTVEALILIGLFVSFAPIGGGKAGW